MSKINEMEVKSQLADAFLLKTCTNSLQKPAASLLMLGADCLNVVFDWLALKDVIAVGKTCKRLQKIAGDFFKLNYAAKCARGENDGIYISSLKANIFSQYIQKVSISGDRLGAYKFIGANCVNTIKHFRVYGFLPEHAFEFVQGILRDVEMLEMNECFFNGEFYENHLKYCPKLKSLSVSRSGYIQDKSILIGCNNQWMFRRYPHLVQFELTDSFELQMNELKIFFETNPQIRTFSSDARSLWQNRRSMLDTNAKLDIFAINICQSKIIDSNNQPISIKDSVYNILFELYERQFHQKLHLYVYFVDQMNLDKMFSLSAIELLNGDIVQFNGSLSDVKSIAICYGDEILNMQSVPSKLLNIQRVYFSEISSNRLWPFICYSPNLRQIKIRHLKDPNNFRMIDFSTLNKEREKLVGATKLTIYVKEDIYLATKWSNERITFSLVDLKRFEASEWEELSARARYFKTF